MTKTQKSALAKKPKQKLDDKDLGEVVGGAKQVVNKSSAGGPPSVSIQDGDAKAVVN